MTRKKFMQLAKLPPEELWAEMLRSLNRLEGMIVERHRSYDQDIRTLKRELSRVVVAVDRLKKGRAGR